MAKVSKVPSPTPRAERAMDEVRGEVFTTLVVWKFYADVFRERRHHALIRRTSPTAFGVLRMVLEQDIVRRLAVLADPAHGRGGKDENLSIQGLLFQLGIDPAKHPKVRDLYSRFARATKRAVSHRHKCIAHLDLPTRLGEVPLPGVAMRDVVLALKCLPKLSNAIEMLVFNCDSSYDTSGWSYGESLLHQVQQADRYRQLHIDLFDSRPSTVDVAALLKRVKVDHF